MQMQPLGRSEALESVGYDAVTRRLRVAFRHGGLYEYLDVPAEVFAGLVEADHPWTVWHEHITSSYDYERLA